MRFKTVRLMTIRNGLKRTISTSSGLELLQMISKAGRWASKEIDCEISLKVWKRLPSSGMPAWGEL